MNPTSNLEAKELKQETINWKNSTTQMELNCDNQKEFQRNIRQANKGSQRKVGTQNGS